MGRKVVMKIHIHMEIMCNMYFLKEDMNTHLKSKNFNVNKNFALSINGLLTCALRAQVNMPYINAQTFDLDFVLGSVPTSRILISIINCIWVTGSI